jgi:N-acetylmuramoyl-L-alanine amidase
MSGKYKIKFYKGEYITRQRAANADKAIVYVEHHFNAGSPTADYACVVVGSNAGKTSREFGQSYAKSVSNVFGCKIGGANGLLIGGFNGRGDGNVKYTNMPAVLLEPLFCSNPKRAEQIRSEDGRQKLAEILADCIKHFFPNGGLIAFSVGHKYKTSKPNDRGAAVTGGGTEADYAEDVLRRAGVLLTSIE